MISDTTLFLFFLVILFYLDIEVYLHRQPPGLNRAGWAGNSNAHAHHHSPGRRFFFFLSLCTRKSNIALHIIYFDAVIIAIYMLFLTKNGKGANILRGGSQHFRETFTGCAELVSKVSFTIDLCTRTINNGYGRLVFMQIIHVNVSFAGAQRLVW